MLNWQNTVLHSTKAFSFFSRNKLIEEFMLLANRTVAETIGKVPKNKKAKVFPYRIQITDCQCDASIQPLDFG